MEIKLKIPQENVIYNFKFVPNRVDRLIFTGERVYTKDGNERFRFLNLKYNSYNSMTSKRFTYALKYMLDLAGAEKIDPKDNPLKSKEEVDEMTYLERTFKIEEERAKKLEEKEKQIKKEQEEDFKIYKFLKNICPTVSEEIEKELQINTSDLAEFFYKMYKREFAENILFFDERLTQYQKVYAYLKK